MPYLIGQSLGRYRIMQKLGAGGMAVVYKAYDSHLDCEVAVKVIQTDQILPVALARALKRFEREAKDVARLVHPNIVKVMDYGEENGIPYLVMPLLLGGTLSQKISANGRMDWKEAANLLIPIADALEYAHKHNIIHRDVKPSNILFTTNDIPMLADFGVAKVLDEEGTMDLTGTNATVGTPEYMAPEQIVSKTVDHRVDIYSLGVVYYEMVTGKRPFSGETPMQTLFKHASEPLTRPTLLNPDLPQEVEDFLVKALMKRPEERFSSMAEMENALRGLVSGAPLQLGIRPVETRTMTQLETVDQAFGSVNQLETTDQDSYAEPFSRASPPASPISPPQPRIISPQKSTNPLWFIFGGLVLISVLIVILVVNLGGRSGGNGSSTTSQSYTSQEIASDTDQSSNQDIATPVAYIEQAQVSPVETQFVAPVEKPTPTITPTEFKCPGMPVSRVKVGDKVTVCSLERLIMRKDHAMDGDIIRYFEPGTKGQIIGGPECEDQSTWWEVRIKYNNNTYEGWMREGTDPKVKYFLCVDNEGS